LRLLVFWLQASDLPFSKEGDLLFYDIDGGIYLVYFIHFLETRSARVNIDKNAERALQDIEDQFNSANMKIITGDSENYDLNKGMFSIWTYGRCFRLSFFIVGVAGLMLAIAPF
jgi:hypothetical protein